MGSEGFGEVPEHAVHRHEEVVALADLADAWPLGVPAVGTVVTVAGFGEAVAVPFALVETHQDERAGVPTGGPDRVGGWVWVAVDSAGSGDFGELFFEDGIEGAGLAIPLCEDAGLGEGILFCGSASLSVVGVNNAILPGVEAFAVVAVKTGLWFAFLSFVMEEGVDFEGLHVDFVEAFFHGGIVDFMSGIGEVAGVAGGAAKHLVVGNGADLSALVDGVGSDEELIGFAVDHAIGGRAADGFLANDQVEVPVDLVEFVRRALGGMGRIGDGPKAICEGDNRAGAALVLVVEEGKVRVDAGEGGFLFWLLCFCVGGDDSGAMSGDRLMK